MNAMDRLDQIESELESIEGYAQDAQSTAGLALDELRSLKDDAGQLVTDWKEYLSDNVDADELYEYLCELGASDLNYIARKSIAYADKQKESEQVRAVYWEEVEANRLARALMEAAFLAGAKSQIKWVELPPDGFGEAGTGKTNFDVNANFAESLRSDLRAGLVRADNADRLNELEDMVKRVQSEIAEMRGDAR